MKRISEAYWFSPLSKGPKGARLATAAITVVITIAIAAALFFSLASQPGENADRIVIRAPFDSQEAEQRTPILVQRLTRVQSVRAIRRVRSFISATQSTNFLVYLAPQCERDRLQCIRTVSQAMPGLVVIEDPRSLVAPIGKAISILQLMSIALAVLGACALAFLAVTLSRATRTEKSKELGVAWQLGATAKQIAYATMGRLSREMLIGSLIGASLAFVTVLAIGGGGLLTNSDFLSFEYLSIDLWLVVFSLPLACVALAAGFAHYLLRVDWMKQHSSNCPSSEHLAQIAA